jgi:hypothetical protein
VRVQQTKIGMPITYAGDFRETIANLRDFKAVGLNRVMMPEAYRFDAVSHLGYAAATTERVDPPTRRGEAR